MFWKGRTFLKRATLVLAVLMNFGTLFGLYSSLDCDSADMVQVQMQTTPCSVDGCNATGRPPLFIGMGRGTTGTHSMFNATCQLGLPSVHWELDCNLGDKKNAVLRGHHGITYNKFFMKCPLGEEMCLGEKDVAGWAKSLKKHIDRVIASDIVAVHDAPYPSILSYMIDAAHRKRGVPPVLLMSEREPRKWAERRVKLHSLFLVVCTEFLDNRETYKNAFDVFQCIEHAEKRRGGSNVTLGWHDVFTHVASMQKQVAVEALTEAMQYYQDLQGPQATYAIDLFKNNMTADDIATDMRHAVSTLPMVTQERLRNFPSVLAPKQSAVYKSGTLELSPWAESTFCRKMGTLPILFVLIVSLALALMLFMNSVYGRC